MGQYSEVSIRNLPAGAIDIVIPDIKQTIRQYIVTNLGFHVTKHAFLRDTEIIGLSGAPKSMVTTFFTRRFPGMWSHVQAIQASMANAEPYIPNMEDIQGRAAFNDMAARARDAVDWSGVKRKSYAAASTNQKGGNKRPDPTPAEAHANDGFVTPSGKKRSAKTTPPGLHPVQASNRFTGPATHHHVVSPAQPKPPPTTVDLTSSGYGYGTPPDS